MHQGAVLTSDSPGRKGAMIAMVGVTAITVAIYAQMIGHGFVEIDDGDYVYENHHVLQGLTAEGFRWAWTTFHAANWHPLTWLSLMLDVELFGIHPGAMKMHNLALHVLNVWLVYFIIASLIKCAARTGAPSVQPLRGEKGDQQHHWCAVFCAAVFALHPLHVESVAWISERKDVLSAAFGLTALLVWIHHTGNPSRRRYAAMLGLFAASLMSKPMFVTLPCVMLLIDWWMPRVEKVRWVILEKVPMFAMVAISCVLTLAAQQSAMASLESQPMTMRLGNAVIAYTIYLRQMIAPANLTIFYPYVPNQPLWMVLAATAVLGGITAMGWRWRSRMPWLLCGWLIFIGMLVPVIGIIQVGGQSHADRYMYLPMVGLLIVLGGAITRIRESLPHLATPLNAACAGWLAVLAFASAIQAGDWHNGYTLFSAATEKTTNNTLAHNNLGIYLLHSGDLEGARREFEAAVRITPGFVPSVDNLALVHMELGQIGEAEHLAQAALAIQPQNAASKLILARIALARGDMTAAIAEAQQAVAWSGEQFQTLYGVANVLVQAGDLTGAIDALHRSLRLNPRYAPAWFVLGSVLHQSGEHQQALVAMRMAQQLDPDSPMVGDMLRRIEASLSKETQP